MKRNTSICLTLSTQDSKMKYYQANAEAVVTLDRTLKVGDSYAFYLYNDQLYLMGEAETGDQEVSRVGRSISVCFLSHLVWIPGRYLMIVHCITTGATLRAYAVLDDEAVFHMEETVYCSSMDQERMLVGKRYHYKHSWNHLMRYGGMGQLKRWLIHRQQQLEVNRMRSGLMLGELKFCNNLLIASPSVVYLPMLFLYDLQNLRGKRKSIDCSKLYDPASNNPYEKLNELMEELRSPSDDSMIPYRSKGCAMYLYHISALSETGGKTIMKNLSGFWSTLSSTDTVTICGTQQELNNLLEQYPSLQKLFPQENRLSIEPFTEKELLYTMISKAEQSKNLLFNDEAVDKLCRLLMKAHRQGITTFWSNDDIDNYLERNIKYRYCQRLIDHPTDDVLSRLVQPEDIDEDALLLQGSFYENTLRELNSMVGLGEIKDSITTLSNQMRFYVERRKLGLHTTNDTTYHAIFTGNPGTGKTTVARLLGKIYHSLGLLSHGEVIYVDRTKLVGRYIGETEENMKQVLQEAQGNVLFIDEAYTLCDGAGDRKDFGARVIDSLLTVLSQKDPDMLVIFAGYEKEMDQLMSMNPGLIGRFPYKYRFNDYTADELMQIAEMILSNDEYILTEEAASILRQSILETVAQRSKNFGNARWIEQFVRNGIIPALADRMAQQCYTADVTAYQRIEASDVRKAYERYNSKTIELKPRRVVGFNA